MELSDEELLRILEKRLREGQNFQKEEQEMFQDLERVSEKLKQAEKLKSNFLSNIRNEINNPLSSVLGLSSVLMEGDSLDETQVKRTAYLIHNEVFNLDFQMRNIFAAAEIEAGEVHPRVSRVNVGSILDNVMSSFRYKADQKCISFEVDTTGEMVVQSDPYMIFIMFMNLVSNAIEYSPANSNVTVTASQKDNTISISFRDFGVGIEKVNYGKIFDRFQQLDFGSTKQHGGHGLGLSVTKELAEALGGRITIESSRSEGSIFTIHLPVGFTNAAGTDAQENWDDVLFENDEVV